MRRHVFLPLLATLASACMLHRKHAPPSPIPAIKGERHTLFALQYVDYVVGKGKPVEAHKCVFAHYTGWLTDGKKFDSSRDSANGRPKSPISFPQGSRRVIVGWDVGFEGMRVGGKRRLYIPHPLGYGERGSPPVIPALADLIFDVEVMAVTDTVARPAPPPPPAGGAAAATAGRGGGGRGGGAMPMCPEWSAIAPK